MASSAFFDKKRKQFMATKQGYCHFYWKPFHDRETKGVWKKNATWIFTKKPQPDDPNLRRGPQVAA